MIAVLFCYQNKRPANKIDLPVVRLNDFVREKNLPVPDLIKIDAEGLDLEVLKGVDDFFGKTEVFMVEAGIACKSIPNDIMQLINFMNDRGYRLFDITDLNKPFANPVLWLAELVFVKKDGIIDSYNWV